MIKVCRCIGLIIAIGACTSAKRNAPPPRIDVCYVINAIAELNGRVIEVNAIAQPDSHYNVVLADAHCNDSTITLIVPSERESDDEVVRLTQLVFAGFPAKRSHVRVRLIGRLVSRPGEIPRALLILDKITFVEPQ